MQPVHVKKCMFAWTCALVVALLHCCWAHEAKDFDDSILYKIEFDIPNFEKDPDLRNHLKTFYTHEMEKYDCVIPVMEDAKEEKKTGEAQISPLALIRPIISATSCSYRIEAYWSYEICHGYHIRQYHEEREGKSIKFQEYYLGKWSEEKTDRLTKTFEENQKAGIKHKTTKIDNIKYPYFEMDLTDGTLCDIIGEPRTTKIRYVCYPHGKNEIYSFKETSSCNYEAIILTSLLCMDPAFHPEESNEVSIKCFNSKTDPHKPLSMLRQELSELQMADADIPVAPESSAALDKPAATGDRFQLLANKPDSFGVISAKITQEYTNVKQVPASPLPDFGNIKQILSGDNCITGGTGWWKYEYCHFLHVRQFHKNKKSEAEIFLGYFDEASHRQWLTANPDKAFKMHTSTSIWHHYKGGSRCDRTGKQREVDVKLTCTPIASTPEKVSMYLLEPKTCQYILVVESPVICDLMRITNEYGFVDMNRFQELIQEAMNAELEAEKEAGKKLSQGPNRNPTGATGTVSEMPSA